MVDEPRQANLPEAVARALRGNGLSADEAVLRGAAQLLSQELPEPWRWTPRAFRVLKAAGETSARDGQEGVGVEHLLLALIDDSGEGGIAWDVLRESGALEEIRGLLLERMFPGTGESD